MSETIQNFCACFNSQEISSCLIVRGYRRLNDQITNKLSISGMRMRISRSNGIWCGALLPTILGLSTALYDVSNDYKLATLCSMGLLFYTTLFVTFLSVSSTFLGNKVFSGCLASICLSAVLLGCFLGKDLLQALALSVAYIVSYRILLKHLLSKYPKTFTLGEAFIVAQSIVLFTLGAIAKFNLITSRDLVSTTLFVLYLILIAVIVSLYLLPDTERDIENLVGFLMSYTILGLILLHVIYGRMFLMDFSTFLISNNNRIKLLMTWSFLVMIAIVDLIVRTRLGYKATTSNRKGFHFLASLVFLSGILVDMELMRMAAGAGLALLLFIEAIRKFEIKPISGYLQEAFEVYSDHKDSGYFAMSPIYLYTGLACPLLLLPNNDMTLEMLSGVMSIGIGDSMASWVGSKYGVNKWPGSNRTVEGTFFNMISQVSMIYALNKYELLTAKNIFLRAGFAAFASSLVEAFTHQVDNLVLPLVTIISFQCVSFLA